MRVVHFRWEHPDGARASGAEVAATLASESPHVAMDRLARWLGPAPGGAAPPIGPKRPTSKILVCGLGRQERKIREDVFEDLGSI